MGRSKRGESSAINLIVGAVIALLIMVILIWLIRRIPGMVQDSTDCESTGGQCVDSNSGCLPEYYHALEKKCKEQIKKCCYPEELKPSDEARFTTEERKALADPIFLIVGNDPKPVTELKFSEGKTYDLKIKFNDKLKPTAFGPVIFYAYDSKESEKIYWLTESGLELVNDPTCSNAINAEDCTYLDKTFNLKYKPSLKDTYKNLRYRIVILDNAKIICKGKTGSDLTRCLANPPANIYDPSWNGIKEFASDRSYFLAERTYPITINSILQISGIGNSWAAEDTVTLSLSNTEYGNLGLRLIDSSSLDNFDQVVDACERDDKDYKYSVTNIIGTTIETNGIDLGLNIGGFRIPTSSSQLKYLTQEKKISLSKGKTDVKIDKATMIKDFYDGTNEAAFIGEKAFLCARAQKGTSYAHAVSQTPLKVDVMPPDVTQDTVQIVYADPIKNTPDYSREYISIASQNYFYKQYPRVIISCQDYGQSGCASYDYYLKTGNYVDVHVTSDSIEGAITGVALQFGLNQLFDYFAKKDPLRTICPQVYSNEFRANTRPTITLRTEGQGIICIRVKDRAGNAAMVWKEILTPQEMIKQVAIETANEAEQAN